MLASIATSTTSSTAIHSPTAFVSRVPHGTEQGCQTTHSRIGSDVRPRRRSEHCQPSIVGDVRQPIMAYPEHLVSRYLRNIWRKEYTIYIVEPFAYIVGYSPNRRELETSQHSLLIQNRCPASQTTSATTTRSPSLDGSPL